MLNARIQLVRLRVFAHVATSGLQKVANVSCSNIKSNENHNKQQADLSIY